MTIERNGTTKSSKKPRENSKFRRRKKAITKKDVADAVRDYLSNSSIHGLQYLDNRNHSTCGRVFWIITVCIALICTSIQVINIWYQWVDDPVVTTLSTISLPVEKIAFPAVTLCPQGSTEDIIDNVLYNQFEEWLIHQIDVEATKSSRKRLVEQTTMCECLFSDQGNLTTDDLQCCFRHFLDDKFPGIYPNIPTKMVTMLNAENPDSAMKTKSVVIGDDEPICDELNSLEVLNNMNERLQRTCPESFTKLNESTCIIGSAQEMSYNDAFSHCKELGGANIFFLDSFEDQKTLDRIIGKPMYKRP